MYELSVRQGFSAAHCLEGYPGSCANMHGHNYTVEVFVRASELSHIGIAMDFKVLRSESEKHLVEGRTVRFTIYLEDGEVRYKITVDG